ncbi:MAG: hypothetical protein AAGA17_00225 [Actinomycetota bacterium]
MPARSHRADDPGARVRATNAERRAAERLIAEHVETHGWWCPGAPETGHQPHPVAPGQLTSDHVPPLQDTGGVVIGRRVLCRSENSRQGAVRRAERERLSQ